MKTKLCFFVWDAEELKFTNKNDLIARFSTPSSSPRTQSKRNILIKQKNDFGSSVRICPCWFGDSMKSRNMKKKLNFC